MRVRSKRLGKRSISVIVWMLTVLALLLIISIVGYHVVCTTQFHEETAYHAEKAVLNASQVTYGDQMYLPYESRLPAFRSNARFKIIELVPYHGMAELGYTIAGEEPITMNGISRNDWSRIQQYTTSLSSNPVKDPLTFTINPAYGDGNSYGDITNNDLFIKTTLKSGLNLTDAEVDTYMKKHLVDVLVLEPSQLNENPGLIDEADMIYIHSNFQQGAEDNPLRLLKMYQKYSKEFMSTDEKTVSGRADYNTGDENGNGADRNKLPKFSAQNDITWNVVLKLVYYGCVQENPLIIQGCAFDGNKAETFFAKLGLLILANEYCIEKAEPPQSAMTLFEKIRNLDPDNNAKTYDNNNQKKDLWTHEGIGWELTKDANSVQNMKALFDNGGLIGDVKRTTQDALAHGGGNKSMICTKIGQSDSLGNMDAPCADVGNDSRDVAIVIGNGQRPTFKVLDLEPDKKFTLTDLQVRKWINDTTVYKVQIVQMTMSEFVGNLDDVNAAYDLIYLGNDKSARMTSGRLYHSEETLTASIMDASLKSDNTQDNTFYYSGNDITKKKATEIKSFYQAGYPVVYDLELLDSGKVDASSNLYSFLQENQRSMYRSGNKVLQAVSGGKGDRIPSSEVNQGKTYVYSDLNSEISEYTEDKGEKIDNTGLRKLSFNTKYGNNNISYRAYLYVDVNHDGVYNKWMKDDSGKWSVNSYGGLIWQSNIASGTAVDIKEHITEKNSCLIPDAAMLGVVSWKLEIVKLAGGSPTGIRSCMTGNVYCDSQSDKVLNVLQIGDTKENGGLQLNENDFYNRFVKDPVVETDFVITTEFQDIRDTQEMSELDLSNYDVIVVGFISKDVRLDKAETFQNKLSAAADKGKGIIFTQDALRAVNNTDSQKWGVTTNKGFRNLLGLDRNRMCDNDFLIRSKDMGFTYSLLNQFSQNKYFSGLSNSMTADRVSMANSAKIARYPFVISDTNVNGFATASGIYQTDLEAVEDNAIKEGKVYYCLSDSGKGNFSISPNDAGNNYYLWRHDSVFYSGVTKDSFENNKYSNEQKLFMNTLINAYGLERGIYLKVNNLPEITGTPVGNSYLMYVDADYDATNLSGTQDITFELSQKGLSDPNIELKFYKCDGNAVKEGEPLGISMEADGKTIKTQAGGSQTIEGKIGEEYTFSYPLEYLNNPPSNDKYHILIEANVKGSKDISDISLVRVLRRSLFDLD